MRLAEVQADTRTLFCVRQHRKERIILKFNNNEEFVAKQGWLQMYANTLIDNSEKLKLTDTLNEIILMPEINEICIATGYWDLKGTSLITNSLLKFLSRNNTKLRLLIGKDPNVFRKDLTSEAYREAKRYPQDYLKIDLQNVEMNNESYQKAAKMLMDYCSGNNPKIEVHIFNLNENDENQFFHSKCYIFMSKHGKTCGIIGSSNFTKMGLEGNAELNFLDTDASHITAEPKECSPSKGHYFWFNEKWVLSKDWTKEFIIEIENSPVGTAAKKNSNLAKDSVTNPALSPYENYIKLLQDKFGMITDSDFKAILTSYLPAEIKPLEYQLNAVQQCYSYMLAHGGFVLGDVVGLGKTIVGILVIKYFIEVAASLKKSDKVLIIVPPAIKSSWLDTVKKFDKDRTDKIEEHIDFLTTGSLNYLTQDFSEEEIIDAEDCDDSGEEFELLSDDKTAAVNNKNQNLKIISDTEIYGLIVIDESHKFRNNTTEMYTAFTEYLETVNAKTGYYPFIGLLSATMQNNTPRDIQNQIYLFEHEPKNSSFEKVEGRNLEAFFAKINNKYSELIHSKKTVAGIEQSSFHSDEKTKQELIALSKEVREKVLSDILVRRTRTDIKKHYGDDLKFPVLHGPENLIYKMDKELSLLFFDTMNIIAPEIQENLFETGGLGYYRYRATMFLDDKYDKVYSGRNMTAKRTSNQLARIMQILLVKRLESSFEAFKESLRNLQQYTQNMITMWENDTVFICPQIDINEELNIKEKQANNPGKNVTLETCFNDIRKKIEKLNKEGRNEKKQNAEYSRKDFKTIGDGKTYIDFLKSDMTKINDLVDRWNKNDYDPKLDRFKSALEESSGFFCKERNTPHKLVIFSEAIATVKSLRRAVENITGKAPLVITSENRNKMENIIKENFDANYEKEKQKNDYDVIITTEVLAEGINLHRANTILNYDTPWNSTRLIQRIGRVNRIGSENEHIYVYNFYPSAQGDGQINLVQNAYTKLQAFHTMFGEDAKIFSQEEELSEGSFEAIIDGEESPQEKYIAELKQFRDNNEERYNFILHLEKAEEKCIKPVKQDTAGNSYFAIKTEGKYGCVYVKVSPNLQGQIIDYMDMFDSCKCETDDGFEEFPKPDDWETKRKAALDTYHIYENKLSKPKNMNRNIIDIIAKANKWTSGKKLDNKSIHLIGTAIKSIKAGNLSLAKRLDKLLNELEDTQRLFSVTDEEITNMIERELGTIASVNNKKNGEAYVFAGFYQ